MNEQELEKVYATIDYLTKANIPVPEELIQRASLMENNYIAEQVIPAVKQAVEKTVSPLLSAFSIEVSYRPESGVHCSLTRQLDLDFEETEEDTEAETEEPENEEAYNEDQAAEEEQKKITRGRKTRLCVKFPDGKIIWERQAKDSLIKAIQKIGIERADSVPDILCDGGPLITNHKDGRKELYPLAKGWWICTHSSTLTKMKQLQKISDTLRLGLKVEITEGLLYN